MTRNASTPFSLDYTYPRHSRDAGLVFNMVYYGVAIPVSYVGNLFTYIIVCKMLRYRDSTSDVLVGGLALNDVLTATIVFTPALISAARGRYFGSEVVCEFSAVTTVWYIYTTFAMLVLISAERWLAITRPFRYKRLLVTGFKLKVIMAALGFFCLMLASLPLLRYPVLLKAGWYCAPVHITTHLSTPPPPPLNITKINNTTTTAHIITNIITTATTNITNNIITATTNITNITTATNITTTTTTAATTTTSWTTAPMVVVDVALSPVPETMYIKLVYLMLGIFMLVTCNVSVAYTLRNRPFGGTVSREGDRKFARIMGVVALLFLFTWLPNLTAQAACLAKSPVCPEFEFWAMRIVNMGVAVNPFVYGVMKTTYRRGYLYLLRVCLHYATFTLLPLPTDGQEIFDLRERCPRSDSNRRKRSCSGSSHPQDRLPARPSTHTLTNSTATNAQTSLNPEQSNPQTPEEGDLHFCILSPKPTPLELNGKCGREKEDSEKNDAKRHDFSEVSVYL